MATGNLPSDWTIANITPIHKKNDKHSPGNYRPISLTSLVVKIVERIIHRKMSVFLEASGKLNPNQHSSRKTLLPNLAARDGTSMGKYYQCRTKYTCCLYRFLQSIRHLFPCMKDYCSSLIMWESVCLS